MGNHQDKTFLLELANSIWHTNDMPTGQQPAEGSRLIAEGLNEIRYVPIIKELLLETLVEKDRHINEYALRSKYMFMLSSIASNTNNTDIVRLLLEYAYSDCYPEGFRTIARSCAYRENTPVYVPDLAAWSDSYDDEQKKLGVEDKICIGYIDSQFSLWNRHSNNIEEVLDFSGWNTLMTIVEELCKKKMEPEFRGKIYRVLGKAARDRRDENISKFLVSQIEPENKCRKDRYVSSILTALNTANQPIDSAEMFLEMALEKKRGHHNNWDAISILGLCKKELVEDPLISILANKEIEKDAYEIKYAIESLVKHNSVKALPHIERFTSHKSDETKTFALRALSKIDGRNYLPLFRTRLEERGGPWLKYNALWCLVRHGGIDDIELMCTRIKKVIQRKRTRYDGDVELALPFLLKYKDNDIVEKTIKYIDKKIDNLDEREKHAVLELLSKQ